MHRRTVRALFVGALLGIIIILAVDNVCLRNELNTVMLLNEEGAYK